MRPLLRLLLGLALLASLSACSHYRLGAPGQPVVDTVFVAPATSTAFAPQAAPLLTEAVRLALARDGRISLATSPEAAAGRLEIHLTRYERSARARLSEPNDTALVRKYAVTLTAEITLTDAAGQRRIDRQRLSVTRDVFTDSGLQPAEYQNMPVLTDALALEIAHALLDRW